MFQGSFKKHAKVALPAYILLAAIIIAAAILSKDFSSARNISNLISQVAPIAVVALGQTIVLMLGGIDLSIGSIVSLSTVIMANLSYDTTGGLILGLALSLLMGAAVGAFNGFGIMKLRVPPMIMTLSTGAIIKGIALYIQPSSGGMLNKAFVKIITAKFPPFNVLGIIIIVFYAFFVYLLATTKWGRNIYAVGGDIVSAGKNGIPVTKTQISVYMVAGIMGAVGGILLASRMFSGDPLMGDTYAMDTITAVIVGGTLITGGVGGVIGTLGGVFLISMTANVLNMLEVFPYYQYIIKGLILVVALFIKRVDRKRIKMLFTPVKTVEAEGEKRS